MRCVCCNGPGEYHEPLPGLPPLIGEKKYKCKRCTHTWFDIDQPAVDKYHIDNAKWGYKNLVTRDGYHNKRISVIRKYMKWPPKSVLDVGCGDGRFLELAKSKDSTGVDVSTEIDGSNINLVSGSFGDVKISRTFSLVTSFHSMEHVVDIVGFFKKILRLSSGIVAIEIPTRRPMRRFVAGHVHGFNGASFSRFIERHLKGTKFETIKFAGKVQGSSVLWIGGRRG